MKKILILIGGTAVLLCAAYGVIRAVSDLFGGKPAETTQSFTAGVAVKTGEKIAEGIKQTPDKKLEEDSELMARKLYHLSKGALKGQIDAILNDSGRGEVPRKMYDAGKDLSERVVKPFARGLSEGTSGILEGSEDKVEKFKELSREGKELLETLFRPLGEIGKAIKQNAPPLPPLPGIPPAPGALPQPPFTSPPDTRSRQDVPSR